MQAVALRAFRTAQTPLSRSACRIIGGCRHPLPRRIFHHSAFLYQAPENPPESNPEGKEASGLDPEVEATEPAKSEGDVEGASSSILSPEIEDPALATKKGLKSTRIRGTRQRQSPEGLPLLVLPQWFWKDNVKCFGDPKHRGSLAVYGESHNSDADTDTRAEISRQAIDIINCSLEPTETAKYSIHVDVYREILSSFRADLTLRPPKNAGSIKLVRPPIVLACPKDGGAYYLDSVVESVATKLEADLIRIDAQDIAQIIGPYIDENLAWGHVETSLLGYEAQKFSGKLEDFDKGMSGEQAEEGAEDDEDSPISRIVGRLDKSLGSFKASRDWSKPIRSNPFLPSKPMGNLTKTQIWLIGDSEGGGSQIASGNPNIDPWSQSISSIGGNNLTQWNDLKITTALETLVNAVESKRAAPADSESTESIDSEVKPTGLIIQKLRWLTAWRSLISTGSRRKLRRRMRRPKLSCGSSGLIFVSWKGHL